MSLLPTGREFAVKRDPRCACVLLLDRSSSMADGPIDELNDGLQLLKASLVKDQIARHRVELLVVSFGGDVRVEGTFQTVDEWNAPYLTASGGTPMAEAIYEGRRLIEERKQQYRAANIGYYRPWLWLLTDGAPNGAPWEPEAAAIHEGTLSKKFTFFAVGVGDADFDVLNRISPPNRGAKRLDPSKFGEMFEWLSKSLGIVANSCPPSPGTDGAGGNVQFPNTGWESGET